MESKKKLYKRTYLQNRKRFTDLENKLMVARRKEFQKVMYRLLYSKWITNKDLLYGTWESLQCYVPAWIGRGYGGEWIHVYVWLSPFVIKLKLPQHC